MFHPQTPTPSILSEPVQAGQKRKSDVSYSVAGANLRMKRRRLEIPRDQHEEVPEREQQHDEGHPKAREGEPEEPGQDH